MCAALSQCRERSLCSAFALAALRILARNRPANAE